MLQSAAYAFSQVVPSVILTGIAVSSCSIFQQDGTKGPTGAPSYNYTVPVLTDIICMDAVPREGSIEADQQRNVKEVQSRGVRHVWLSGAYYSTLFPLLEQGLSAIITDSQGLQTAYTLLGVEPDSQNVMTRLRLQVVTV